SRRRARGAPDGARGPREWSRGVRSGRTRRAQEDRRKRRAARRCLWVAASVRRYATVPLSRPERISIVEVAPRDGLQSEDRTLSTEAKLELLERLADAGHRRSQLEPEASRFRVRRDLARRHDRRRDARRGERAARGAAPRKRAPREGRLPLPRHLRAGPGECPGRNERGDHDL